MHNVHILTYSYENGGASKVVFDLAKYQVEHGDRVTILNHSLEGDVPYKEIAGIEVREYKSNFISTFLPLFSFDLWKELKYNNSKYDVIHLHGLWNFSLLACHLLNLHGKCVVTVHGCAHPFTFIGNRLKRAIFTYSFQKNFLKKLKLIHLLHEGEKKEMTEYLGEELPNFIIVPNGIDIPINETEQEKIGNDVLFLSRLHQKKGLDLLLPAFKKVLETVPDAKLLIAGPDFGMLEFVNKFILAHKLESSILVLGSVHGEQKNQLLRNSKVFALPSYSEGFSIAVLEALVFGVPIVVSTETGLSNEINEFEAGKVIQLEVNSISEAIIEILIDKQLAERYIENGKRLVKERFETSAVCKSFMKKVRAAFN